jgi:23S rRNA (guanine2445-N2)-methyltransferase / 23S rRNA (guanine2069-N7)-methyltransferase
VEVTSSITQGPLARMNTHFAEQRIKDGVVDRFRLKTGGRPGVDLARPSVRINVHLSPTEAVLSLDLSGESLHRRGYRLEGGEAPLRENLAAAILLRAKWPEIAAAGGTLVDPMCGSGTLLVEAALMAADIAPGLQRDYYGFFGWLGFDRTLWTPLVDEARRRHEEGLDRLPAIFGFDGDQKAVGKARANARRAGFAGRIAVDRRDLSQLTPPAGKPGLVITNPPYGKRLGEVSELVETYELLGERLRESFAGWQTAVFTGNPELGAHLGLRARRSNVFHNGPIECRLLLFDINPQFRIQGELAAAEARASGATSSASASAPEQAASLSAGAEMFANRLAKNLKHLRRWANREGVTCYRVYDADLPEYSAGIDLYEDWVQIQEYAAPATVDPVKARRRLKEMVAAVPAQLGVPANHVVLKVRRPQRGTQQYDKITDEGRFVEAREGGLRFLINLTDYLDTGLFLDHRITRQLIREMAPGRRFLNLFAYTGAVTVYAAAGGAASTTTVDLSTTYLDWARRNLELNGFAGPEHGFIRADCMTWLQQAARNRTTRGAYDLIFLDPPTFSNSKSMTDVLDIQRDHPELIRNTMALLSRGGVLIFSTNSRRFKMEADLLEEFEVIDITKRTIPPDYVRNPRIHSCFQISARQTEPQVESQPAPRQAPKETAPASPPGEKATNRRGPGTGNGRRTD